MQLENTNTFSKHFSSAWNILDSRKTTVYYCFFDQLCEGKIVKEHFPPLAMRINYLQPQSSCHSMQTLPGVSCQRRSMAHAQGASLWDLLLEDMGEMGGQMWVLHLCTVFCFQALALVSPWAQHPFQPAFWKAAVVPSMKKARLGGWQTLSSNALGRRLADFGQREKVTISFLSLRRWGLVSQGGAGCHWKVLVPGDMARFHEEARLAAGVPGKAQAGHLTPSAATWKSRKVELPIRLLVISGAAVWFRDPSWTHQLIR